MARVHYFVKNTLTDSMLKIKLLNASKAEIGKDLAKATDFDRERYVQADLHQRIRHLGRRAVRRADRGL